MVCTQDSWSCANGLGRQWKLWHSVKECRLVSLMYSRTFGTVSLKSVKCYHSRTQWEPCFELPSRGGTSSVSQRETQDLESARDTGRHRAGRGAARRGCSTGRTHWLALFLGVALGKVKLWKTMLLRDCQPSPLSSHESPWCLGRVGLGGRLLVFQFTLPSGNPD